MVPSEDRQFVGYHNRERMGQALQDGSGPFTMLTNKAGEHLRGHVVWVVEGHGSGKARQYDLCLRFTVQDVEKSEDEDFRFAYSGTVGDRFTPRIPLAGEPWFREFQKSVGNFGTGATTIQPRFLEELERLVAARNESGQRVGVPRAATRASR